MTDATAKDDIRELLATYCFLLDGYELAEFSLLFTETGTWESRNGTATGPAAVEELMSALVPPPGPGTRRKHLTTNIVIRFDGDDRATVRSNFLVVRDTSAGPAIAVAGTYTDRVVRTGAGWLFEHRKLAHDITGESGLNPT
ncbi:MULTISPECIES: nuclear transport factor 2 family protein [unclassified Amycolatopsis]|uniref:nuclear transport factor 2 family protein n=1 Tax=unclassified Amycolatopsis TaxID=2618356 RepID=UPI001C697477|nr:nuclear transport factor 2 family protein [Amycolatopsis sp. DSM 110486]QYN21300.1 nuclear transport factor 2 family protein [Amycolatopsis sp. DSM 110486]